MSYRLGRLSSPKKWVALASCFSLHPPSEHSTARVPALRSGTERGVKPSRETLAVEWYPGTVSGSSKRGGSEEGLEPTSNYYYITFYSSQIFRITSPDDRLGQNVSADTG